jgi:opacity protein-like surface antigen
MIMKNLALLSLSFIVLISCQTSNLAVDYDNTYNFSVVKTYNYYDNNTLQLNQIDSANFIKNLDEVLKSKGLIKEVNNPDIMIAVQVHNQEENRTTSIANIGIGGGSGWLGMGTNIGIPINKKVMNYSFRVDFDDTKTKTLVWTGKTSNIISYNASPESKTNFYNSNIRALMKKYPPQKK